MAKIDRRDLLKATGAATGAALLSACARRDVAFIEQPLERRGLPGASVWRAGVCSQCEAGCGLSVRTVDAEAKKIEGNGNHPISRGGVCAIGHSILQQIYAPDRITAPLRRVAARGPFPGDDPREAFAPATWEEALEAIGNAIATARSAGPGRVQVITRRDGFVEGLWARLAQAIDAAPVAIDESWTSVVERRASEAVFGRRVLPVPRLEDADLVLAIGADALDRWHNPVHFARALADWRARRTGDFFALAAPRCGLTAAKADLWLPVRPGSEGVLARALAGVLIEAGRTSELGVERYSRLFPNPSPTLAEAAAVCDISMRRLEELAARLRQAQAIAVLAGGSTTWGANGLADTAAAMALGLLVGEVVLGPGDVVVSAAGGRLSVPAEEGVVSRIAPAATPLEDLLDVQRRLGEGSIEVLLVSECNPVHRLPAAWSRDATGGLFHGVGTVVALADGLDDTARAADWILPVQADLERLAVAVPWPGGESAATVLSLASPVVASLGEARHPGDVVLALAQTQSQLAVDLPWPDVEGVLRAVIGEGGARIAREGLRDGVLRLEPSSVESAAATVPAGVGARARRIDARGIEERRIVDVLAEPTAELALEPAAEPTAEPTAEPANTESVAVASTGDGALVVVPFASVRAGEDGRAADRDWLRELPDPLSTVMWDVWVELAPADAERAGLATGHRVRLLAGEGGERRLDAAVFVSPTVRPGTVSVPLGFGHRARGASRFRREHGPGNVLDLIGEERVEGVGAPAVGSVVVRLERIEGPPVAVYGRGLRQAEEIPRGWRAQEVKRR